MSTPDLRVDLLALATAAAAVTTLAASLDDVVTSLALFPPAAVDAALPGSLTGAAFRGAARAWAVVSRSVAAELRQFGDGLQATAHGFAATDALLADVLPRGGAGDDRVAVGGR